MIEELLPQYARQLLSYDPRTGIFRWRYRAMKWFEDRSRWITWNKRFAGKVAGSVAGNGYVYIGIEPYAYLAHRLAWLFVHGHWPEGNLDHINGDRSDNRIANLRSANHTENAQNQGMRSDNTSGFKGVSWHKQRHRWVAAITKDYKKISLGLYDTADEAHEAYIAAKQVIHTFHPGV